MDVISPLCLHFINFVQGKYNNKGCVVLQYTKRTSYFSNLYYEYKEVCIIMYIK
jgi:hypothetical protein